MIGQRLSHYRIVEIIGAGGMGEVYRARDEQLNRDVALKLLPSGTTDTSARSRLLKEAQTASSLNHPYICTIYEVGQSEGQTFIAMEYVKGRPLIELASSGGLPVESVLRYGLQIAEALEHAHEHGVIHRDLKSANVIVTPEGRAKVLDFGLAKRLPEEDRDATLSHTLTQAGSIVGTLQYMAPETLRGGPADACSDIWSLGVVLYEMAIGQRPFQGQTLYDLTSSILRDSPSPFPPRIPVGLQTTILRCLAKEPTQRYKRASEVRAALEAITSGTATVPSRARSAALSRRLRIQAGVAVTFLLLASVSIYRLTVRRNTIDSLAVLPFVNANADPNTEYLSDGLTDGILDSVAKLPNVRVISRTSAFHYKGKDVDPRAVGRELGVQAVLTGTMAQHGDDLSISAELVDTKDNSRIWGDQFNRKLPDILAVQQEISREISEKLLLRLTGEEKGRAIRQLTDNPEAYRLYLKGLYYWYKGTPEGYEKSREYFQQAIDKDPTYARAYIGLSWYYAILADSGLSPPREAWPKAREAVLKAQEIDSTLAEVPLGLGSVKLLYDWDWSGAEREYTKALKLNPSKAELYREYSIYQRTLGHLDESIASAKRAEELDPLSVGISLSLGWTYFYGHRYEEAIEQFRRTLPLAPDFVAAHEGLAKSYQQKGMEKEAIAEFQTELELSGNKELAAALGQAYKVSGYREAVKGLLRAQLEGWKQEAKKSYVSPFTFATLYAVLDDKDKAFAWLEKAYEDRSDKLLDLRLDPDFDNLRSDPRFADLERRVGLP